MNLSYSEPVEFCCLYLCAPESESITYISKELHKLPVKYQATVVGSSISGSSSSSSTNTRHSCTSPTESVCIYVSTSLSSRFFGGSSTTISPNKSSRLPKPPPPTPHSSNTKKLTPGTLIFEPLTSKTTNTTTTTEETTPKNIFSKFGKYNLLISRTNEGDSNEDSRKRTEKKQPQDAHKQKDAGYGNKQDIGSTQLGFSKVGKDVDGSGEGKNMHVSKPPFKPPSSMISSVTFSNYNIARTVATSSYVYFYIVPSGTMIRPNPWSPCPGRLRPCTIPCGDPLWSTKFGLIALVAGKSILVF